MVKEKFLPTLFGQNTQSLANIHPILALLVHRARLGIPMPSATGEHCYRALLDGMAVLVDALKEGATLDVPIYLEQVAKMRWGVKEAKVVLEEISLEGFLDNQPSFAWCHLLCAKETDSWLTTIPS